MQIVGDQPALADHRQGARDFTSRDDDERGPGDATETECSGAESRDWRTFHSNLPFESKRNCREVTLPARRAQPAFAGEESLEPFNIR